MKQIELAISKLMLIGVLTCILIVSVGGIYYLTQHGSEHISHLAYPPNPTADLNSIRSIFNAAFNFSSLGIIQLGLLALVIVQILRVVLTTWFFIKFRDYIFLAISLFVLIILLYSSLWRF